jgi:hypothetical protein
MTASPDALTFVSAEPSLAKRITVVDGVVTRADDPPWPRIVAFQTLEIRSPDDLLDVLRSAAEDSPAPCVVRADPLAEMGRRAIYDDRDLGPAGLRIMPRSWVGYDIEKVPAGDIDPLHEPERAVAKARRCLHPAHHDASVVWQITASAGKRADELRLRLWFLLDRPMLGRQLERWNKPGIDAHWLDPVTLRNEVIPHFIGVTIVGTSPDPCPQRWGMITGARDRVAVPDSALALPPERFHGAILDLNGHREELKAKLGERRYQALRLEAIAKIKAEVEAVRSAGAGARHPTYLSAAARIKALCEFWDWPADQARAKLEAAYLETLTADEARRRERGSTRGVWAWLARRAG